MADRQRSFADMYPDLLESMTSGAQWKEAMRPRTKKEMARQLTQEDRKWLKERRMQDWLDNQGNLLSPQDPAIAPQVLDYMMKVDPRRPMMKGFQKFILPKLSKRTRKRQKRQMKEQAEINPGAEVLSGDKMDIVPSIDKMGYNPADKYVGEARSPSDHAMGLANRFLQFLRDKDARTIDPSTVPDPDVNLNEYIRDVTRRGEEEARRREAGLPPTRRRESDRFDQVSGAVQSRLGSMQDLHYKLLKDKMEAQMRDKSLSSLEGVETASRDLMSRVFGRRKSTDRPPTNR